MEQKQNVLKLLAPVLVAFTDFSFDDCETFSDMKKKYYKYFSSRGVHILHLVYSLEELYGPLPVNCFEKCDFRNLDDIMLLIGT